MKFSLILLVFFCLFDPVSSIFACDKLGFPNCPVRAHRQAFGRGPGFFSYLKSAEGPTSWDDETDELWRKASGIGRNCALFWRPGCAAPSEFHGSQKPVNYGKNYGRPYSAYYGRK